MYDLIITALQAQQFNQAAQLLKQWQQKKPQDPWLQLAIGQYWEAKGELEKAQVIYTRLLQNVSNTKVLSQTREAMQRVRNQLAHRREHDLSEAKQQPGATATAVLILKPVAGEQRQQAAEGLSNVMQLDAYSARLKLPSQTWRLYRVGPAGELQYFCEQLNAHQTPAGVVLVEDVKAIPVFRVQTIQSFEPQITVVCQNGQGQRGTIQLEWSDVTQWLVGQVPIYESVVDLGPWGKLTRKEATQDYAEIIDWHLHGRGCLLRLCDRAYKHREAASPPTATPVPEEDSPLIAASAWKSLKTYLQTAIPTPPYTDFAGFGEGALDFIQLMPTFEPHIDLARNAPSAWDEAFHLYSSLRFLLTPPGSR